jgi:hypothetical protein
VKPYKPYFWTGDLWTGDLHTAQFDYSDALKKFTDKMQGHIRREFRYRAFAKAILEQLPDLRSQLRNAADADNLDRVLARWNTELDDIAKL